MTKQYKLVKCYPGSVELDTIVTNLSSEYYCIKGKTAGVPILKRDIENNPEFWEEVKQEEYTILSVKIPSGAILEYDEKGNCIKRNDIFSPKDSFNLERNLRSGGSFINSVRRNSDNSIFSIGDMCNPIETHSKNRHKITKIEFCKVGYLRIGSNNYYLSISLIEHSEKLFTTKDGVDLYKNDEYYTVLTGDTSAISEEVNGPYVVDVRCYVSNDIEYFSSKEKAQEYLDSLKPKVLLTTEDGVPIKEGDSYWFVWVSENICAIPKSQSLYTPYFNPCTKKPKTDQNFSKDARFFSTKEAVENYILMNKAALSINEVFDLLEDKVGSWNYSRTTAKVMETFKNYVKSKS